MIQAELKTRCQYNNDAGFTLSDIKLICGMDITYLKNTDHSTAACCVYSYPEMNLLHTVITTQKINVPYISGFLAFREVPVYMNLYQKLITERPELDPDVILIDGNGKLHHTEFGSASHLGVILNKRTIGCAKKLFYMDGLNKPNQTEICASGVSKLVGESGKLYGYAYLPANCTNPIYISPGHRLDEITSLLIVKSVCNYRVPEPVRMADILSRAAISSPP